QPRAADHSEASLLLTHVALLTEAPLNDDTTALVAGRYSTVQPFVRLFAPDVTIGFWDYQVRLDRSLRQGQNLRLLAFGSQDRFGGSGSTLGAEFHRVDLAWTQESLDGTRNRAALTLGQDESFDTGSIGRIRMHTVNLRVDHHEQLNPQLQANAGFDVRYDVYQAI